MWPFESKEDKEKNKTKSKEEEYKAALEKENAEKKQKEAESLRDKMLDAAKNIIIFPGSLKEFEEAYDVEVERIEIPERAKDVILWRNLTGDWKSGGFRIVITKWNWFFWSTSMATSILWKHLVENRIYAIVNAHFGYHKSSSHDYDYYQGMPIRLKPKNPTESTPSSVK